MRLWVRGDFFRTGRTTDVNDLSFDDRPFRFVGKLLLHDGTDTLSLGKVGVNGRPMLRIDLAFETTLTAKKDRLLADPHFDRRPVRTELIP